MKHLVLVVSMLVSTGATANAAELVPLGFLYPNDAGKASYVQGLSADGLVAVGFSDSSSSHKQAFRWTQQSGMTGLGFLETAIGRSSEAMAASCDGSVIVGYASSPLGFQAFRWTQQSGMQPLGFLNLGAPFSIATSVSCDGSVVVGYSSGALGEEAFRWTANSGIVGLGELPGGTSFSRALGISDNGKVIVGFSDSGAQGGFEAFAWTALDGMVGLGDVGGVPMGSYDSTAVGIAGNSTDLSNAIITGRATPDQAFRWTSQSGMVGLGFNLPAPVPVAQTSGQAMSADGSYIVGSWRFFVQQVLHSRAMLWDAVVGMRDIKRAMNPAQTPSVVGWTLEWTTGISATGTVVVGNGISPMNLHEGWLIRSSPPPAEPIDWEKTQSHIVCCWQPPGPEPWMRVFDGSMSGTNADCRPLVSFEWDFGDGETGSGEIGRHTFSRPGAYRVQLTVTDACRGVATDVVEVEIGER